MHGGFGPRYLRAYGISHELWRNYTIDHLVPIEAGGSNEIRNLWPEHRADAKRKDDVENALHEAVCVEHRMTLEAAQAAMARDWHTAALRITEATTVK